MKSRSLVLFDIDGTLLRGAGQHHKEALLEGIRKITGYSASFHGIETAGRLDHDLIEDLLRKCGAAHKTIRSALNEIAFECQAIYGANCGSDLSSCVCQSVHDTLTQLQERGAVLALVTGNLSEIGWKKMELSGLRSFFSLGGFAEDGRTRAQVARVAVQKARRAGLIASRSRISQVGDHANDVAAAKANGFISVAVATGVMPKADLAVSGPDILVDHLGQLDLELLLDR